MLVGGKLRMGVRMNMRLSEARGRDLDRSDRGFNLGCEIVGRLGDGRSALFQQTNFALSLALTIAALAATIAATAT